MSIRINDTGDGPSLLQLHEDSLATQNEFGINKIDLQKRELDQLHQTIDDGNLKVRKRAEKVLRNGTAPGADLRASSEDDELFERHLENPADAANKRQAFDLAADTRREDQRASDRRLHGAVCLPGEPTVGPPQIRPTEPNTAAAEGGGLRAWVSRLKTLAVSLVTARTELWLGRRS